MRHKAHNLESNTIMSDHDRMSFMAPLQSLNRYPDGISIINEEKES
jgi:hypothetical protein